MEGPKVVTRSAPTARQIISRSNSGLEESHLLKAERNLQREIESDPVFDDVMRWEKRLAFFFDKFVCFSSFIYNLNMYRSKGELKTTALIASCTFSTLTLNLSAFLSLENG